MTRALAAALLALLSLAAAACGNGDPERIDTGRVERNIEAIVEGRRAQDEVESVKCPAVVELEQGDVFTCAVKLERGSGLVATATQVNDEGRVHLRVP